MGKNQRKAKVMSEAVTTEPLQIIKVAASEMQNNFGFYGKKAREGALVIVTKNGDDYLRIESVESDWRKRVKDISEGAEMKRLRAIVKEAKTRNPEAWSIDYAREREGYLMEKHGLEKK